MPATICWTRPSRCARLGERLVSANAYLGAGPIVEALAGGADIVITGRAADPAMFLAPQIHEFSWSMDDWTRLGRGTVLGHLLECAGQITGGYFADPGQQGRAGPGTPGLPDRRGDEDGSASSPRCRAPAGWRRPRPAPSSYSTRSTIPHATSSPTWWPISRRCA